MLLMCAIISILYYISSSLWQPYTLTKAYCIVFYFTSALALINQTLNLILTLMLTPNLLLNSTQ